MTIQQERQDAAQRTNPFTVPKPERVKAERSESRMLFLGIPLAVVLAVVTILPNHGLTPSEPTPAPTSVVHTSNH